MLYFKLLCFLVLCSNVTVFAGDNLLIRTNQRIKIRQYLENMQEGNERNPVKDEWLKPDKGLHVIGSMICFLGSANSLRRFADQSKNKAAVFGAGFTFSLGVAKELHDQSRKSNIFSFKDLLANIAGISIGGLLLNLD